MDLIVITAWCSLAVLCFALGLVLATVCTTPPDRPVRTWTPPAPSNSHPAWAELDRKQLRAAALQVHRELEGIRHALLMGQPS